MQRPGEIKQREKHAARFPTSAHPTGHNTCRDSQSVAPLLPASQKPSVKHSFPPRMHLDRSPPVLTPSPIRPAEPSIPSLWLPGSLFSHADRPPTCSVRLTVRQRPQSLPKTYRLVQISQDQPPLWHPPSLRIVCSLALSPFFSLPRNPTVGGQRRGWKPVGSIPGFLQPEFPALCVAPLGIYICPPVPVFLLATCGLGPPPFCKDQKKGKQSCWLETASEPQSVGCWEGGESGGERKACEWCQASHLSIFLLL
ncbi:hypothetical protein QBC34DRAFT_415048 [Podospora aff. communis PSN243]|uniref:Uncharacterized protein n=1 Tax=Podospora aff. communis PSN243 TaxID=3040156 RepID=A0AAV9G7W7_9PEZI|nr:hypothetical protein QBC34DRAFT_415048 [Podospora aff. communis PSN243]